MSNYTSTKFSSKLAEFGWGIEKIVVIFLNGNYLKDKGKENKNLKTALDGINLDLNKIICSSQNMNESIRSKKDRKRIEINKS